MKTGAVPTPPVIMNFLHPPAELPPSPLSHVGDSISICRNGRELLQLQPQRKQRRLGRKGFIPLRNEVSSETSTSNMRSSSSRSHDSRLFRRSCRAHQGYILSVWFCFGFFSKKLWMHQLLQAHMLGLRLTCCFYWRTEESLLWLTHTSLPVTPRDHFKHADQKYSPGQSPALTR